MSAQKPVDLDAMEGHTPGPWDVFPGDNPGIEAAEVGISIVVYGDDEPDDDGGVHGRDAAEQAANARLIAGAWAMRAELIERRARDAAVERLVAAAGAYYDGYCQDEASDELAIDPDRCSRGFFTGASAEQIEAARELRASLAAVRGGAK